MTRVGFLGPHGTFAEEAVLTQPDLADQELRPLRSVPDVISAVERDETDVGLVPLENSIEGTVTVTLDTLAFDTDLLIQREIDLPISLNLCALPGTRLDEIRTVLSHPNPLGQSRVWLSSKLPNADTLVTNSTAEAAEQVARGDDRSRAAIGTAFAARLHGLDLIATEIEDHPNPLGQSRVWLGSKLPDADTLVTNSTAEAADQVARGDDRSRAAIGTAFAARLHGLDLIATEIEDHPENETRFVLVGHGIPAPTGHDKTSVVCFQREDRPGSLLAILQEFAARAINLTKLESRPTKRSLGDYCFFIDFNGHIVDELVADCLRNLAAKQAEVKFLGSYPVAGEDDARQRREAADKAWRQAAQWVDDLRGRVAPPGDTT